MTPANLLLYILIQDINLYFSIQHHIYMNHGDGTYVDRMQLRPD